MLLTDTFYPRIEVTFGGADSVRPAVEIDAEEFIGVKSFKAKGKRISTYSVESVVELEPTRFPPEPEPEPEPEIQEESGQDGQPKPIILQGDLFALDCQTDEIPADRNETISDSTKENDDSQE